MSVKTNFDKIKAMSSEEFAYFLETVLHNCSMQGICPGNCPLIGTTDCTEEGLEEWLESEAGDI